MESNRLTRMKMLVQEEGLAKIQNLRVIVFGVGGVGGQAVESLVRAGIGHITIVDRDVVEISNTNRQIIATNSSIGKAKVEVLKDRLLDINPTLSVLALKKEINAENIEEFCLRDYDYVIDAIDSIRCKIALILYCLQNDIKIVSSMGAGNRLDPTQVRVIDVFKTSYDPLAKMIRSTLRKNKLKKLMVVTSLEQPFKTPTKTPSSSPFVPPAFGLAIASYVIKQTL
jgi:tRNA A37 threonylcarbamoyladenosine dehydratase